MTQPTITDRPDTVTYSPTGWAPPAVPPQAPPAKRKTGRYIAGAVVLFFIGAGIAGAAAGDKKDATSSDGVVTTPTTASAPSSRVTTAPTTVSISGWTSRYGGDDAETLGNDMSAMQADAAAVDLSGMSSSCRTFQRHLATAKSHLPTPDAQLTSALTTAYGYFSQATAACISGIENVDADEFGEMATYLSLGTASIKTATARVEALS